MKATQQSRFGLRQLGQGMTEYIIIVALIAVAAIGVYTLFGKTIRAQVAGLANEVSGAGGSTDVSNAKAASGSATTEGTKDKKMGSYTN
ncbi:Flp family type IVb pilin [Chitinimonas sp.]|uniref:Flp family type IVb pilin n=1 Tax=Chitinimonas sp. TaxID=1934313 RepID=UPI0035AFE7C5